MRPTEFQLQYISILMKRSIDILDKSIIKSKKKELDYKKCPLFFFSDNLGAKLIQNKIYS